MNGTKENKERNKLIILGFDGASPDLLSRWAAEGLLPTFKKMMDEGAYGPLRSVPNMFSPAAWTSFATGKNPGKHGIFRFTERKSGSYQYTFVNGAFRDGKTFWEILCGDKTGCVVGVPMTYPVEKINGCMISGFDAPSVDSKGVCYPEGLISEVSQRSAPYQITPHFANFLRKGGQFDRVAQRLLDNLDRRYQNILYLMEKYDWDLFTAVFGETDWAQHFFWKFQEPHHPDYRPGEAERYGDTILRVYQKVDEITGKIMDRYPEATILIVSDHGGALNPRGEELLARWLEELGLLTYDRNRRKSPVRFVKRSLNYLAGAVYHSMLRHLSSSTKMKLAGKLPRLREGVIYAMQFGDIDWRRTKAFCDGATDDIWINLAGRDPLGTVAEAEYDALCDFICSELKNAVDATSGKPIIDAVYRRNEIYAGPHVDRAGDITLRWKSDEVITGIRTGHSPENIAPKHWTWPADLQTGAHALDGVLLAVGPSISGGKRVQDAELMDIAPTVLYCFGEVIPEDFDGKVIEQMIESGYLEENPPRYGAQKKDQAGEAAKDIYSDDDADLIEQRLKDLGYL